MVKSVLFICLGNICRSPMAEAIFRYEVNSRGVADKFLIDSAALGDYHIGKQSDERALKCLEENGIKTDHIVRQITTDDFNNFDIILGMDHDNMKWLNKIKPQGRKASLELLGSYDPKKEFIIEDPYYGAYPDFVTVYEQCKRCCPALLDHLLES